MLDPQGLMAPLVELRFEAEDFCLLEKEVRLKRPEPLLEPRDGLRLGLELLLELPLLRLRLETLEEFPEPVLAIF